MDEFQKKTQSYQVQTIYLVKLKTDLNNNFEEDFFKLMNIQYLVKQFKVREKKGTYNWK